jgi:tripartite-type tricarboxylate transporter receptor subunit TctC
MKKLLRLSALLVVMFPSMLFAQGRFVKVVVPYAPGGNIDVIARLYAKKAAELLKETWIVENISGGSGTIGTYAVAKAAADGRTLLFTGDVHAMAPLVVKEVPYDPLNDFVPIARVVEAPLVFVVNPARVRARNLTELVAEIRADPKQFSFAIGGLGGTPHLGAEVFRSRVSNDILIVPYRGTGPAVSDVVSGQVNMMVVAPLPVMQLVRTGKLRALAVTAARRFAVMPEVPTAEEAGISDFVLLNSYGFWGPKGLSAEVVARINAVMRQASESSDIRPRLMDLGVAPIWETPEAFSKHALAEFQSSSRILQKAGVKPE